MPNQLSMAMEAGLVSVVIPVCNPRIEYIGGLINSILAQTYSRIELVISDDDPAASVSFKELLYERCGQIRLRYVENTNGRGIFANLNNAIAESSGEWIQIFSQDDTMDNSFIDDQVKAMCINPEIGMVFSAFKSIDEQGKVLSNIRGEYFSPGGELIIQKDKAVKYFVRYGCMPGNISPVMLKRKVLEKVGWFNQDYPYAGDFEYWVRLSRQFEMYYYPGMNLSVRRHGEQASTQISNAQLLLDLRRIYGSLAALYPIEQRSEMLRRINRQVGTQFIHYTVRKVIEAKLSLGDLKIRLIELDHYPFKASSCLAFYICSLPLRLLNYIKYELRFAARV